MAVGWTLAHHSAVAYYDIDVPVASAMISFLADQPEGSIDPIIAYCCWWIAFNNIYAHVAADRGVRTVLHAPAKPVKYKAVGDIVQMTNPIRATETDQLEKLKAALTDDTRDAMIRHDATRYFAGRVPRFEGVKIHRDGKGQKLNGVLKVSYTVNRAHAVWSPISKSKYRRAKTKMGLAAVRHELAAELIDILYTIRNNAFHGSKRMGEERDQEVVLHALPLLQLVVQSFLYRRISRSAIEATRTPRGD